MEYRIRKTDEGAFELAQIVPEVVGTFQDKAMAEKVMWLLASQGGEDVQEEGQVAQPEVEPEANVGDEAETIVEVDMEAAFARLAAGEKLKDVAEDIGIPWTSLRGSWAHRKSQGAATEKKDIRTRKLANHRAASPRSSRNIQGWGLCGDGDGDLRMWPELHLR
ncbi:hypothetical protein [uncultured Celeribacter sp.]|uniref:hypothetical protein n=1 Tax=uncultured Celeribacter sp. TaxID=1303376 RepID=UPI002AA88091|nr:hypothetical protein [uncultured Celeribacter sp.]